MDLPPPFTSSSPAISRLIPSLPDDLSILCISRIPRSHHPFISAVSRSWRAFLRSPLFFSVRLELGASEHFLFINFNFPTEQSLWFILDRLRRGFPPNLIPLPAPPLASTLGSTVVAIGHSFVILGGSIEGKPSNVVQIYDARFNCWRLGPPMFVSRQFAAAGVISGRIYIVGGCTPVSEYWAEEFDLEKQRWKRILSPPEIRQKWMHGNSVIRGKLIATADQGGVIFDPAVSESEVKVLREKAWSLVPPSLDLGWRGRAAAVGEVLYPYGYIRKIKGYDFVRDEWKKVEGIDKKLPKFLPGARLTNLGELLCFVWEGRRRGKEMEVICAGVSVTRTESGGLHGSVKWLETIALPFPKGTKISNCISLEF